MFAAQSKVPWNVILLFFYIKIQPPTGKNEFYLIVKTTLLYNTYKVPNPVSVVTPSAIC